MSAVDADKYELWKQKGRFPSDKAVKDLLSRQNNAYNEIKTVIPEFFEQYDELLKKANKYIHKQGVDTFYISNNISNSTDQEGRTNLFLFFEIYHSANKTDTEIGVRFCCVRRCKPEGRQTEKTARDRKTADF